MASIISLRFCGPQVSYSAPKIDIRYQVGPVPALSQVTGLIGNALRYDHSEAGKLQHLQSQIQIIGTVLLAFGEWAFDFHTTDLGQPHMRGNRGWTTRGKLDGRGASSASTDTHLTYRAYWADLDDVHLIRVADDGLAQKIASALQSPARPLFLGRAAFPPSEPIFAGIAPDADDGDAMKRALDAYPDAVGVIWGGEKPDGWHDVPDWSSFRLGGRDWENNIPVAGGSRYDRQFVKESPLFGMGFRQAGLLPTR